MWPTLLKIGSFEITTFGLMMFLAFLAGGYFLARELRRYDYDDEIASTILLAAAIGGIAGGKIYYAILYRDMSLLFSRAGLVWYGGFLGGVVAGWIVTRKKGIPFPRMGDMASPGLAIGYAIGRIGCFLVGDDYGRPTESWVGIAFPKGAPPTTAESLRNFGVAVNPSLPADAVLKVHPTQLYESAAALAMFGILLWLAKGKTAEGKLFGLFLLLLGFERFLVEFVRAKDDRFLGPFTVAQLISLILMISGTFLILRRRAPNARREAASGR